MSMYDGWSPERIEAYRAYHREYARAHRAEISKQRSENRQYNLAKCRAYEAEWRKKNKDKVSACNKRNYEKRKRRIAELEAENKALKAMIDNEARRRETRADLG